MKLVPPKKVRIFTYNTFSSALLLEPKALEIIFHDDYFDSEVLFELESIIAWCTSHTEVKSIVFSCRGNQFIQGFNLEEMKTFDESKILKLYSKLHHINQGLTCLPQTIVVDLKEGAKNEGLTFASFADVRVSTEQALFQFDQITHGLLDATGLFSKSINKLNISTLRSLVLSAIEFNIDTLNNLGCFTITNKTSEQILNNVAQQSNMARAQTKCALIGLTEEDNKDHDFINKIFKALLSTSDYKKEAEFINLRVLKENLQNAEMN